MNIENTKKYDGTPFFLLKAIEPRQSFIDDLKNNKLYFSHANSFRDTNDRTDPFKDELEGFYIKSNNASKLNCIDSQTISEIDNNYQAKIYKSYKDVYIASFFFITVEEIKEKKINPDLIKTLKKEFTNRKIAVFWGPEDLMRGLERENQINRGAAWGNFVNYQDYKQPPIFKEEDYDKDPRIGYLLKRKTIYSNQREFRICIQGSQVKRTQKTEKGALINFGEIGDYDQPSVSILDSVDVLSEITVSTQ